MPRELEPMNTTSENLAWPVFMVSGSGPVGRPGMTEMGSNA